MLRIGLTGGIGSGKTTAARIFEVLRIPVYYADNAAKRIMQESDSIKRKLQACFGISIYLESGLNKKMLADLVFNDAQKLDVLNSIVHPETIKDAENWMAVQTSPYVIKEAALLFESGANKNLDLIIGVSAPPELRIARAMARDNLTREQVLARLGKQMKEEEKLSLCHFVLINDEQQMLLTQVLELHQKLLGLANTRGSVP